MVPIFDQTMIEHSRMPSSVSRPIRLHEYEVSSMLDSVPEREWRILNALAQRREEEDKREELAIQFHKMWQKEKEEREMVDAAISEQYKRYIHQKREQDRTWLEYKHRQREAEQREKKRELVYDIQWKEKRSAQLLANIIDRKNLNLKDKAIEEVSRAVLAAERRLRQCAEEEFNRRAVLEDAQRREEDAERRRTAMLRDASKRVAITNAQTAWESTLLKQEAEALDKVRRASHAAHVALVDAKCETFARARDECIKRARKMAAFTARMREVVRSSKITPMLSPI